MIQNHVMLNLLPTSHGVQVTVRCLLAIARRSVAEGLPSEAEVGGRDRAYVTGPAVPRVVNAGTTQDTTVMPEPKRSEPSGRIR